MNCLLCSSAQLENWVTLPNGQNYWICSECKLIWLDEMYRPSREKEELRYRTHQNSTANSEYLAFLKRTALPVANLLSPEARGLDYGCGPSEGMKAVLAPMGFHVESYDPIFFPHTNLLKNRYDFVLCSEAAEHFFCPAKEFAAIDALLKNGGIFGVSSKLAVGREEFPNWTYRRDPTHVVFYNRETVEWIAKQFGWNLLHLESPLWIFQVLSSGGRNLA